MLAMFSLQFVILGVAASVVGCVLALGGQQLLVILLGSMVRTDLPPPTLLPAFCGDCHRHRCCCWASRCRR